MVPGAGSPSTCTGTSTVTFSPRRMMSRSMCSMFRLTGSRWTSLTRAVCFLPSTSRVTTAFAWSLTTRNVSWPGSERCCGSAPCPYSTAGMRPARRVRRAAPLPNSVRTVAVSVIWSATWVSSVRTTGGGPQRGASYGRAHVGTTASITEPGRAARPCRSDVRPSGVPRRGNLDMLAAPGSAGKAAPASGVSHGQMAPEEVGRLPPGGGGRLGVMERRVRVVEGVAGAVVQVNLDVRPGDGGADSLDRVHGEVAVCGSEDVQARGVDLVREVQEVR